MKINQLRKHIIEKTFYFLQNPLVEIAIYENRFVVYYQNADGKQCELEHLANPVFSNSRMLVADFEKALLNIKEMLAKLPKKWYLGKPIILANVKEDVVDGLTAIEHRILTELFLPYAQKVVVFYQDKQFVVQALDKREVEKAKQVK